MLRRTPLFAAHQQLRARLMEFGGWEMPLHYAGIVEEHRAVRGAAGLFDISHMGEFLVSGPGAGEFLNHSLTNDLGRLGVGQGQYTLLCRPDGGVVDDLYVFRLKADEYLLMVNAARTGADWDWLQTLVDRAPTCNGFHLRDLGREQGAVAVQGPGVAGFIEEAVGGGSIGGVLVSRVTALARNEVAGFVFQGCSLWVARTGYTGEDGFELWGPGDLVVALWDRLLEVGQPRGLQPAGLGARDTLRTEMGYPLYGHELREDVTPLEAGLGAFVALDKADFVGRSALLDQRARGLVRRCVAFRLPPQAPPPRPGYRILGPEGEPMGEVVSGTQSPSLGVGIGLGYVPVRWAEPGQRLRIEVRGRSVLAEVVRKPIYRRPAAVGGASVEKPVDPLPKS